MSDVESENAAQHLLGLRELGQQIAKRMPDAIEEAVCTSLGVPQRAHLIEPLKNEPEQDVTPGLNLSLGP